MSYKIEISWLKRALPKILKKSLFFLFRLIVIFFITLLLFELVYRYNIIDFYKPEYKSYNKGIEDETHVDLLIFGDSFSAGEHTYVSCLRDKLPNKKIINSSIQGIGLKQVNTFAKRRLKKHKPKKIVYQVYVGNDLTDLDHLNNYKTLSFSRNVYWDISDYFLSISYANFRLGGFKSVFKTHKTKRTIALPFSVENYSERTALKLSADSLYINNSILLENAYMSRYKIWRKEFKEFVDRVPSETSIYVMFIPHCVQLNSFYYNNIKDVGAYLSDQETIQQINYPFYALASEEFKERSNVKFINVLDFFQKSDTTNHRIYYENDPHLNTIGHQVLCDYIIQNIYF